MEDKKKYIAVKEEEAGLLRWAFEWILENNFWVALRNSSYCGKIFTPPLNMKKHILSKGSTDL